LSNAFDDPWNTAGDTGPADPWASPGEPGFGDAPIGTASPVVETKESKPVTAVPSEDVYTLTFKQSGGYDAPWIVVRAGDAEEAKARVTAMIDTGLAGLVTSAANQFAGTKQSAPAAPKPSYQQPAQQAPAQQYQPQSAPPAQGDGRTCGHHDGQQFIGHGQMNYREFTSKKNGNFYKAYFCPLDKNDPNQCRAVYV
jgi:hypothetical protein